MKLALLLLAVVMVAGQTPTPDPCGYDSIENELVTALFPPELLQTESGFESMGVFTICAKVSKYYNEADNDLEYYDVDAADQSFELAPSLEQSCWWVYNVTADWVDLMDGLAVDDTVDNVYRYRGAVNVHSEKLLQGDVYTTTTFTRESDNPLLFEVLVPTTVTVQETGVEIFAAIAVQVVLVTHAVTVDSLAIMADNADVSADLSVATTIQYPFYLDTMDITTNNTNLEVDTVTGITETTCSDPSPLTTACTQTWEFSTLAFDMMGSGESCPDVALEAFYFLAWTVDCFVAIDPEDCPIDDDTDSGSAWVFLESSDICPVTVDQVDLEGTLESYEDALRAVLKDAFFFDDTIYFEATVSSNELDIVDSKVIKIEINGPVLIYDESIAFTLGTANLDLTDGAAADDVIWFAFDTPESIFTGVPALGSAPFTVYATLEVQFEGLPAILLKKAYDPKALLQDLDTQPVSVGADMTLSAGATAALPEDQADDQVLVEDVDETTTTTAEKSDDWVLAVVVVVVLVAALGACLACGYMAHKRRSKRASVAVVPNTGEHTQLASGSGSSEDVDF